MAAPVPVRPDFTAAELRGHARRSHDATQARRLLALAAIYDGGSRGDAAFMVWCAGGWSIWPSGSGTNAGIAVSPQTVSRELHALLGYRKRSARPRHQAQAAGSVEDS
jgi:hypothetical protein